MKKHSLLAVIVFLSGALFLHLYLQRVPLLHPDLPVVNKEPPKEPQHLHSGVPTPADEERTSQILAHENGKLNVPINFYGKVVDQDGIALPGASVYYDVLGLRFIPGANFDPSFKKEDQITTGSDGTFFIGGITATSLTVSKIEKFGYRAARAAGGTFGYAGNPDPFKPDSNSPVTFMMFREETLVMLNHYDKRLNFAWDSQPRRYDLMTGLPSPSGIMEIIPKRARYSKENRRDFDWSLQINIEGGGLVYVEKPNGFIAPLTGYLPSLTFGNSKEDSSIHHSSNLTLYVRLSGGNYVRLRMSIDPGSADNSFGAVLEGFVNPNVGSRVLEYVPSLKLLKR